jgi:hypothetical protein
MRVQRWIAQNQIFSAWPGQWRFALHEAHPQCVASVLEALRRASIELHTDLIRNRGQLLKQLSERAEEATTNVRLLGALAACFGSPGTPHAASVANLIMYEDMCAALSCRELLWFGKSTVQARTACQTAAMCVSAWCQIWRDDVDAALCEVQGPGIRCFVSGPTANAFTITARTSSAALAEFLEDVTVIIEGAAGQLTCSQQTPYPGCVEISYAVDAAHALASVLVTVHVRHMVIWQGCVPTAPLKGELVCELPISSGNCFGIAVTDDAKFMLLSAMREHQLQLYELGGFVCLDSTAPRLLHAFG